jgi:hypothetical protein
MTIRRQRREDPAYLTAMREAKELFDAEMAKNSMKGRGRPKTVVVATPAAAAEVEIDHEVADEIVDLAGDEGEIDDAEAVVVAVADEPAFPRVTRDAPKPGQQSAKHSVAPAARAASRSSAKPAAPARTAKKPVAKKKAAPVRKAAKKR